MRTDNVVAITHLWQATYMNELPLIKCGLVDRWMILSSEYHLQVLPDDYVEFSGRVLCRITGVRRYDSFAALLAREDTARIDPDSSAEELLGLWRAKYSPEQENEGVFIAQFCVV
ncbi:MAG: hypothetical protein C3F02_02825 [Parcubacteria group bacterium]|nr:MAG: hypothetical protein C3F02_02825 [Parcubacteria group bacterium]